MAWDVESESGEHLWAHLIACAADGRSEVDDEAGRCGPPPFSEKGDASTKDA
jgi:hypothetical protein